MMKDENNRDVCRKRNKEEMCKMYKQQTDRMNGECKRKRQEYELGGWEYKDEMKEGSP